MNSIRMTSDRAKRSLASQDDAGAVRMSPGNKSPRQQIEVRQQGVILHDSIIKKRAILARLSINLPPPPVKPKIALAQPAGGCPSRFWSRWMV